MPKRDTYKSPIIENPVSGLTSSLQRLQLSVRCTAAERDAGGKGDVQRHRFWLIVDGRYTTATEQ